MSVGSAPSRSFRKEAAPCLLRLVTAASLQCLHTAFSSSLSVQSLSASLVYEPPWWHLGPTQITQNKKISSQDLYHYHTSAKTSPSKVTFTGSRDWGLVSLHRHCSARSARLQDSGFLSALPLGVCTYCSHCLGCSFPSLQKAYLFLDTMGP